jgi:hypothetical protein
MHRTGVTPKLPECQPKCRLRSETPKTRQMPLLERGLFLKVEFRIDYRVGLSLRIKGILRDMV